MGFESTMNLPSSWYVICEESELSATSPNALRRFGEDWVAWKTPQGDWVLQADRCPHRSARLSDGWIADGCVVCPFHGFRYSGQGECTLAPEIGRAAPGLKVQTHPLRAQEGFLWLKVGKNISNQIP